MCASKWSEPKELERLEERLDGKGLERRPTLSETPIDDLLAWLDMLDKPLPYSDATITVLIVALAQTMVNTDFVTPKARTSSNMLEGLSMHAAQLVDQLLHVPDQEEVYRAIAVFGKIVTSYRHQALQQLGTPLSVCNLEPPCPYHRDKPGK